MSKLRTWLRAAPVALAVALAVPFAGAAATEAPASYGPGLSATALADEGSLRAIRVHRSGDEQVKVSLRGDRPLEHEAFLLENPYRLVVDLPGVVSRVDRTLVGVDEGGVFQVRTAQFRLEPVPVARVVFDLDEPLIYDIQTRGKELIVSFGGPLASFPATRPEDLPAWTREGWQPDAFAALAEAQVAEASPNEEAAPDRIAEETADVIGDVLQQVDAPDDPEQEPSVDAPPAERVAAVDPEPQEAPAPQPRPAEPARSVSARQSAEPSRSIGSDAIERLLRTPKLASSHGDAGNELPASFRTQTINPGAVRYTGKRISLNLVDASVKEVFRLFHEISGINFVLDPSVSGRVTIVVDDVPWDQALDLILKNNGLDKVLDNNVIRIATTEKLATEAAQRKQLKEAKELEVEPITITRTLSYAKAKDVESVIREGGVLSQRGKVIVDERTNTLIISDIPKKVEPLDQLISTLDAETPQVMIEARIVETSRDFVQDLGVVWGLNAIADASRGTSTGLTFPSQGSVRYGLNLPGAGGASNLALKFGNIIDSFTLDVALNTLETEGRGRVLSSPKIATQNNERAEIEQGVRIPVVNTTATEINVEFVSASLRMQVTPQITAEGTVILDVLVENNSPDFVNTVDDVPPINTQRAQTKVLIEDGGTTVIGGIFTVNEGESEVGVPWFRKVPLFGWLFKSQNVTRQNRELLIFITPKIMKLS